jgi:phosphopantetheinyl transferase (holo-ACP synthase)
LSNAGRSGVNNVALSLTHTSETSLAHVILESLPKPVEALV